MDRQEGDIFWRYMEDDVELRFFPYLHFFVVMKFSFLLHIYYVGVGEAEGG